MANLGFVGLGAMGGRVTKRLLDAGHSVTGYNRTQSKAQWLLDAGMRWADTPQAVSGSPAIIFPLATHSTALPKGTSVPPWVLAGPRTPTTYLCTLSLRSASPT